MLVLGLDTATAACSVALVEGERLLAAATVVQPRAHAARLLPLIDGVFREAGRGRDELQGVAAGIGPGSFTGLRIGLATAKAVAFALDLPCAPVPTPAAIACALGPGWVAVTQDARRGAVYAALYRHEPGPGPVAVVPPRVCAAGEWWAMLPGLVGEGPVAWVADAGLADPPPGVHAFRPPAAASHPWGWAVALLGARLLAQGQGVSPDALAPLYLRRTEAEERWEARQHGCGA